MTQPPNWLKTILGANHSNVLAIMALSEIDYPKMVQLPFSSILYPYLYSETPNIEECLSKGTDWGLEWSSLLVEFIG